MRKGTNKRTFGWDLRPLSRRVDRALMRANSTLACPGVVGWRGIWSCSSACMGIEFGTLNCFQRTSECLLSMLCRAHFVSSSQEHRNHGSNSLSDRTYQAAEKLACDIRRNSAPCQQETARLELSAVPMVVCQSRPNSIRSSRVID